MAIPAGYSQLSSGFWQKSSDASSPYVFDGTSMVLASAGSISGVQYAEGDTASAGNTGTSVFAVRRDTASAGGAADGEFTNLSTNDVGELRVTGGEVSYELETAVDTPVNIGTGLTQVFALDCTGWKRATIYFYGPSTALTGFALSFKYKSADTYITTHSVAADYATLNDGYLLKLKQSSGASPVVLPAAGWIMMQVDIEGANLFKLEASQTAGATNASCKVTLTR